MTTSHVPGKTAISYVTTNCGPQSTWLICIGSSNKVSTRDPNLQAILAKQAHCIDGQSQHGIVLGLGVGPRHPPARMSQSTIGLPVPAAHYTLLQTLESNHMPAYLNRTHRETPRMCPLRVHVFGCWGIQPSDIIPLTLARKNIKVEQTITVFS